MLSLDTVLSANSEQLSVTVADELLMLSLKNNNYYGLNDVGAFVWQKLQTPIAVKDIVAAISAEYDIPSLHECEQDVLALVTHMHEQGLVDIATA